VQPKEINFFTVSGVAATRLSPGADSTGLKSLGKIKEWFYQARLRGRPPSTGSFSEGRVLKAELKERKKG
jgi:hypothetical protein